MSATTRPGTQTGQTELVGSMARAARLAPSVHNTQPWRLRPSDDALAIRLDPQRVLPVLDPYGRLRTISCGAALRNAEVAAVLGGRQPVTEVLPDRTDPDLLAVVRLGGPRAVTAEDTALGEAVRTRRAHRRVNRRQPVEPALLADLFAASAADGTWLALVEGPTVHPLAELLVSALKEQAGRPDLVDEVETWVRHHPAGAHAVDGIPMGSLGNGPYPIDSLVQEATDPDLIRAADVAQVLQWSSVVSISTPGDSPGDWVRAGRALQDLWLRATAAGLVLGFVDQATQQRSTRPRLREALRLTGFVQIVVRLGRPLVDVAPTPRRPLEDLLA